MNLPPHFTFDLALAKLGWPLVTRDGRKAEVLKWDARGDKPLSGFVSLPEEDDFTQWYQTGEWAIQKTEYDLHLSANLSDPAVRAAVEAAHKAGEAISWWDNDDHSYVRHQKDGFEPVWAWLGAVVYLPTRLLSQLPQPWTPPPLPEGWEIYEPEIGSQKDKNTMLWIGRDCPDGQWDNFALSGVIEEQTLAGFIFARRKWTLPEPPPGQQWHRTDWSCEMLPEGWRPLLAGEETQKDTDAYFRESTPFWQTIYGLAGLVPGVNTLETAWVRTRRPLPAPVVYWSAPEHVPGPVCWVGEPDENKSCGAMVLNITPKGFFVLNDIGETHEYLWGDVVSRKLVYSTDRLTWLPCTLPAQ